MRALILLPDNTYIPVMDVSVSVSVDCIFLLNIFLILHRMSDLFVESFEYLGL